jgi:hypothetical protein
LPAVWRGIRRCRLGGFKAQVRVDVRVEHHSGQKFERRDVDITDALGSHGIHGRSDDQRGLVRRPWRTPTAALARVRAARLPLGYFGWPVLKLGGD